MKYVPTADQHAVDSMQGRRESAHDEQNSDVPVHVIDDSDEDMARACIAF